MKVACTEDFLVFFVQSETKASDWHRVDLESIKGNGECSCQNFQFRLKPRAIEGRRAHCKHISVCRDKLVSILIPKLIEERKKKSDENKKARTAGRV